MSNVIKVLSLHLLNLHVSFLLFPLNSTYKKM